MRCVTAKRACGGYEDNASLIFRQYEGQLGNWLPFRSIARKCSAPVRTFLPGTDIVPEDGFPKEISYEKVEEYALRAFLYDYCIVSMNRSLSRGFLSGLEVRLHHLGLHSDLAKACKVVAFANHSIKLHRPLLMQIADAWYHDMLGSLGQAMKDPLLANTAESMTIAMLLGLYEVFPSQVDSTTYNKTDDMQIIRASEIHKSNHNAHARGVAAILQIGNSPLDLLAGVQGIQFNRPSILNRVLKVRTLQSDAIYLIWRAMSYRTRIVDCFPPRTLAI